MEKIKNLLRVVRTLARQPRHLLRVLDEEAEWREYVLKKYNLYQGLPTIDILELFPDFEETISPYSFLDGGSLATDLALLKGLAKKKKVRTYFEIGTWRGESVANLATVARQCASVSLPDDEMREMGLSVDVIRAHRFFSNHLKNVSHIRENSMALDYSCFIKQCDLVFIDGNHAYEFVKVDTSNAFKLLRDDDSIIVWHDYAFNPETVRWSVLAGILDGSPPEAKNKLYHVSNTMCAVYLRDNVSATFVQDPARPTKSFTIKLSACKV